MTKSGRTIEGGTAKKPAVHKHLRYAQNHIQRYIEKITIKLNEQL